MGLYDSDKTGLTSGDIESRDYWRAKYNATHLEEALKSRQSEGAIGFELVSTISLLDDLLKAYPNHEELKKWRERAVAVKKMVDPNANSEGFNSKTMWHEHSFREAYVGLNFGKMAAASKNWGEARDGFRTAGQKLDYLSRRVDGKENIDGWSAENIKWIGDAKKEAAELGEDAAKR